MSDLEMFRPPINRAMRVLDRSFFTKKVPISAAAIFKNKDISTCRKILEASNDLLAQPIASVQPDPTAAIEDSARKCLLLRPEIKHDDARTWSPKIHELHSSGTINLISYTLMLEYAHWSYADIIRSIIPEDEQDEVPMSFATVGHVAHLNLRDQYLPYKQIIAEVLRDKSNNINTVINKLDDVGEESEFRTFRYEVLAGPDDLNVEVREEDCRFRFDYSKVYWNSRLHTEHQRLVSHFKEGEAICDVMAGIGPFAVPAGKKRIFVYANDLNPESYKCLVDSIQLNKVSDFVLPFNEDGHQFIRTATSALLGSPHQVILKPKLVKKPATKDSTTVAPVPPSRVLIRPPTFQHYVMNLPATAINFLPSFIGLYSASQRNLFYPHTDRLLPMVHVYCFNTKSDDNAPEKIKICEEISQQLNFTMTPDTPELEIWDVRDVAPKKRMFCASFRLPEEVAFRET